MAVGHIALGAPGALRQYSLANNGTAYARSNANPFAAQINTQNPYGEPGGAYNEWVMDDWQAGVGKVDAEGGGYLFGHIESRVPHQLILPAPIDAFNAVEKTVASTVKQRLEDDMCNMPLGGTTQVYKTAVTLNVDTPRIAIRCGGPSADRRIDEAWAMLRCTGTAGVSFELWNHTAGAINASQRNKAITVGRGRPVYEWYRAEFSSDYAVTDTYVFFVIKWVSGSDVEVAMGDAFDDATLCVTYDGSTWAIYNSNADAPIFYLNEQLATGAIGLTARSGFADADNETVRIFSFNATTVGTYLYEENTTDYGYSGVYHELDDAKDLANFYQCANAFSKTWVPLDANESYTFTAAGGFVANGFGAHGFARIGGLLYLAVNNNLYYTSNGTTWTGPFAVTPTGVNITGMAEAGGIFFVAAEDGLYEFAPGDFGRGIMPFSASHRRNGRGMIGWNGAVYCPVGGRLLRMDASGAVSDIWLTREDSLRDVYQAVPSALTTTNNWLVMLAGGTNDTNGNGTSSVWAYTGQGWHFLAALPGAEQWNYLVFDRASASILVGGRGVMMAQIPFDDRTLNPYNAESPKFDYDGWIEFPKFYGGQIAIDKDWDSIYALAEHFTMGSGFDLINAIEVYYQDENGDVAYLDDTWTYLGVLAYDTELRWTTYATRPVGKWIRLGLRLKTNDQSESPKIEALRVKYLPYLKDRYRWQLGIEVHANQQLVDGTVQPSTADTVSEMTAHLDSMIQRVLPVIFTDVTGTSYEVTITNHSRRVTEFEYYNSAKRPKFIYDLTIEQVQSGTYTV